MISADEVRRIAALAKLELDDELPRMQRDLGRILELVDQIGGRGGLRPPGISDLPDQESGRPQAAPTRPDEPRPSLNHDDVAANAAHFLQGQFVVPRILGGE